MAGEGFCTCRACWASTGGSCRTEAARSGSDNLFSKIHPRSVSEGSSCLTRRGAQQYTHTHVVWLPSRRGKGTNQAVKVGINSVLTVLSS